MSRFRRCRHYHHHRHHHSRRHHQQHLNQEQFAHLNSQPLKSLKQGSVCDPERCEYTDLTARRKCCKALQRLTKIFCDIRTCHYLFARPRILNLANVRGDVEFSAAAPNSPQRLTGCRYFLHASKASETFKFATPLQTIWARQVTWWFRWLYRFILVEELYTRWR